MERLETVSGRLFSSRNCALRLVRGWAGAAWLVGKALKRGVQEQPCSPGGQGTCVSHPSCRLRLCLLPQDGVGRGGPPASRLGDLGLGVSHVGSSIFPPTVALPLSKEL